MTKFSRNLSKFFCVFVSFGILSCLTLHATPTTEKASSDFSWKWEFAQALNTNAGSIDQYNNTTGASGADTYPDWDFLINNPTAGKSAKTDGNGTLKLITPGGTTQYGYLNSRIWKIGGITKTSGWTLEIRIKAVEDHSSWGCGISINPNDTSTENAKSALSKNSFYYGANSPENAILTEQSPNFDDYYIYRIAAENISGTVIYSIWKDGQLIGENLSSAVSADNDSLVIGDYSNNYAGEYHIDYIRFTSGAYAPPDVPEGTIIQFSNLGSIAALGLIALLGSSLIQRKRKS